MRHALAAHLQLIKYAHIVVAHTLYSLRWSVQHFTDKVLPKLLQNEVPKTVILCRSYFEFVQIRNLLRRKEASFCTLSEYTSEKGIGR